MGASVACCESNSLRYLTDLKPLIDGIQMHVHSKPDVIVSIKEINLRGQETIQFDPSFVLLKELKFAVLLNLKGTREELKTFDASGSDAGLHQGSAFDIGTADFFTSQGGIMQQLLKVVGYGADAPKRCGKESRVYLFNVIANVSSISDSEKMSVTITSFSIEASQSCQQQIVQPKAKQLVQIALEQTMREAVEDLSSESNDAQVGYGHPLASEQTSEGQVFRIGGPPRVAWHPKMVPQPNQSILGLPNRPMRAMSPSELTPSYVQNETHGLSNAAVTDGTSLPNLQNSVRNVATLGDQMSAHGIMVEPVALASRASSRASAVHGEVALDDFVYPADAKPSQNPTVSLDDLGGFADDQSVRTLSKDHTLEPSFKDVPVETRDFAHESPRRTNEKQEQGKGGRAA